MVSTAYHTTLGDRHILYIMSFAVINDDADDIGEKFNWEDKIWGDWLGY